MTHRSLFHRLAALVLLSPLAAQDATLTLEKLFHPTQRVAYLAQPESRLSWLPSGELLEMKLDKASGLPILRRVNPRTGEGQPCADAAAILKALVAAGASEAEAKAGLGRMAFTWHSDFASFLVPLGDQLYWVSLSQGQAKRLLKGAADAEPSLSPDGLRVAFLRGNDLHVIDIATGQETRLTQGGSEHRLNGRLDWVYQEEVYGRGSFKGYWWAPDSQRIAFLSLDVSKEPVYTLADDRTQPQRLIHTQYPKAGDPNPVTTLGVVDLKGRVTWTQDPYAGQESLIVKVGFDPKGRLLAAWQNRIQTWMDLRICEGTDSRVFLREEGKTWQEDLPLPRFLKDGRFLWESDRSGFRHLYLYSAEGQLIRPLTEGKWDVRSVLGVDEKAGRVIFMGTEQSPIGQAGYTVTLAGKTPNANLTRITLEAGTHALSFNPTWDLALDRWTDAKTPTQQRLVDGKGKLVKLLFDSQTAALKALRLGQSRFVQIPTRDGFPMEAQLVLPVDFDPAKKYPVFQATYGGPGAPSVRDAWGRETLWAHFLAQQGIVTFICDNRSASKKGVTSAHGVYKRLGAQELEDLLDGVAWLKQQGWADTDRIALEGWSYGGYLTAYAMTHAKAWKLGIIGAPVTDYRLYDSIYTERYMGLPKDNPDGYAQTNLNKAAVNLHGKVLLLHGTLDDNVHPQNTIMFLEALQKAGHPASMLLIPGCDHSPRAPHHQWARFQAMWHFLKANL